MDGNEYIIFILYALKIHVYLKKMLFYICCSMYNYLVLYIKF